MCGIAGILGHEESFGLIHAMLAQLGHRGPDNYGITWGPGWALGAARLAVIDLSGGNQPAISEDRRFRLILNGEIFNHTQVRSDLEALGHRFRSHSDTEVLLHALMEWDTEAIPRLEGQFAFAYFDTKARTLLLGRDRFGERPLYWHRGAGTFAFASEIKSLLVLPHVDRRLSAAAIGRLAILWATLPDESCFSGINALPPGHWLRATVDSQKIYCWSWPGPFAPSLNITRDEAASELRRLVFESIARRLDCDVEVGCYLSGGLDSSIAAYVAQELMNRPLRTFSVTFDDPQYDESSWQADIAKDLQTLHHTLRICRDDIRRVFPAVVYHAESPLIRTAAAPMYLLGGNVKDAGIKVVLTGEGADEAFLGYDVFKETLLRARLNSICEAEERLNAVRDLHPYLPHFSTVNAAAIVSFYQQFDDVLEDSTFSHAPRFSLGRYALRLFNPDVQAAGNKAPHQLTDWLEMVLPNWTKFPSISKTRVLEYATLLGGHLLSVQGDRMAAANGIETRSCFLDHTVVDFASSLPIDYCLRNEVWEKSILREAFGDLLPPAIASRRKTPYRAPDAQAFLQSSDSDQISHVLATSHMRSSDVIDSSAAEKFLTRLRGLNPQQISPREDQAFVLLLSTLILEENFIRTFKPLDSERVESNLAVKVGP